jgi:uncharacterized protein YabE (DUF348 family)
MAGSPTAKASEASQSGRKRRLWIIRTLFTTLLVFTLVAGVRALTMKEVSILLGNGQRITITTIAARVETALSKAGVQLFEGDVVTPNLDTPLRRGDTITVKRAYQIHISVDGKTIDVRTAGDKVRNLLQAAGVVIGSSDKVIPALDTVVKDETTIKIIRVSFGATSVDQPIPFKTVRRSDPTMDQGKTRVAKTGVNGVLRRTYKITYENGKQIGKHEIKKETIKAPVDAVVYVGTRILPKVVHTSGGKYLQYTSAKTMLATAYTPSDGKGHGITATGLRAKKGIVAVDPKVIPLGSRVYVQGYGEAIAADTGGSIKGLRIDLCFATHREAIQFGRKPVKVYVLAKM